MFIQIDDDVLYNNDAKRVLLKMSKENKIKNTGDLLEKAEKDHPYKLNELRAIYKEWNKGYVKKVQFPQYAKFIGQEFKLGTKQHNHAHTDLNKLIGLDSVKSIINDYINYSKLQQACKSLGGTAKEVCRHMTFIGNPGTAKTTVARIVAQIMKENGLLSNGNLIEVGGSDIVSKYVGGTAPKVKALFEKAMGNVLFIDEAYSLYDGKEGMYGDETINAIVQEMENRSENLVVIKDKLTLTWLIGLVKTHHLITKNVIDILNC